MVDEAHGIEFYWDMKKGATNTEGHIALLPRDPGYTVRKKGSAPNNDLGATADEKAPQHTARGSTI